MPSIEQSQMSLQNIYVPFALRMHGIGLARLQDPNWTGLNLYYHLKRFAMGRETSAETNPAGENRYLFWETVSDGVLFQIGRLLFGELLEPNAASDDFRGEDFLFHVDCVAELWLKETLNAPPELQALKHQINSLHELYEENEEDYFSTLDLDVDESPLHQSFREAASACEEVTIGRCEAYAANYADRVFHDRELCQFVSQLVLEIGIDGGGDSLEPFQWIERRRWPTWVERTLHFREKGACPSCGRQFHEFSSPPQIDHIVPLSRGGTNDLVNLQLLCAPCNNRKSANLVDVRSSIPAYLGRMRSRWS